LSRLAWSATAIPARRPILRGNSCDMTSGAWTLRHVRSDV